MKNDVLRRLLDILLLVEKPLSFDPHGTHQQTERPRLRDSAGERQYGGLRPATPQSPPRAPFLAEGGGQLQRRPNGRQAHEKMLSIPDDRGQANPNHEITPPCPSTAALRRGKSHGCPWSAPSLLRAHGRHPGGPSGGPSPRLLQSNRPIRVSRYTAKRNENTFTQTLAHPCPRHGQIHHSPKGRNPGVTTDEHNASLHARRRQALPGGTDPEPTALRRRKPHGPSPRV